ncbi:MAG: hypothetical protein AB3N28_03000 [Kordiimonas sp.]
MVGNPSMSSRFKHCFLRLSDHFDCAAFLPGEEPLEPRPVEQRALSVEGFLVAGGYKRKRYFQTFALFLQTQSANRRNLRFLP